MDTQLLENALRVENPFTALRAYLQSLVHTGYPREQLVQELMAYSSKLRAEDREADDDLILDMIDFLVGWCSSHMKI